MRCGPRPRVKAFLAPESCSRTSALSSLPGTCRASRLRGHEPPSSHRRRRAAAGKPARAGRRPRSSSGSSLRRRFQARPRSSAHSAPALRRTGSSFFAADPTAPSPARACARRSRSRRARRSGACPCPSSRRGARRAGRASPFRACSRRRQSPRCAWASPSATTSSAGRFRSGFPCACRSRPRSRSQAPRRAARRRRRRRARAARAARAAGTARDSAAAPE